MKRVQQHHELMVRIQKHRNVFNNSSQRVSQTTDSETTPQQIAANNEENMETSESPTC